ncbi:AP-4 complex subunit beta-1-like [Oceanobacillus picturae]|uniref:AP-4 complex subunit beta-1-like n=2 Tax=Oceanobacillus picturae TaxID=171693 RepID=A0A0U9HAZ2_9BACI|nr:AP-4 complex subunit beta-1-like [Oceanobacillus picturae]
MKRLVIFIGIVLFVSFSYMALTNKFPSGYHADNPTAKEVLSNNPNADIFQLDNVVYSNASDREWINAKVYTKGEFIGEVKKRTTKTWWYQNFYASQLPAGTKIYSRDEEGYQEGDAPGMVLVEYNNELLVYQALIEG